MSHHLSILTCTVQLPRWSLAVWALLLSSCTLTGDDYTPIDVDALAVQPDLPVPGCAGGAQCCASAPCGAGLECREGSCQSAASEPEPAAPSCSSDACSPPASVPEVLTPEVLTPEPEAPEVPEAPVPATCSDLLRNGDETSADCGGSNCPGCADGLACNVDIDCQSGRCVMGSCAAPTCSDGVQNGDEPSADCGGSCPNCPPGRGCNEPEDCQSSVCNGSGCAAGVAQCCQAPTCSDRVQNTNETDVDCGGRCPDCPEGSACEGDGDCQSEVCDTTGCAPGVEECCQAPSCLDGVANGDEPVVDCGNVACGLCAVGSDCTTDAQCETGLCQASSCADSCGDGVLNGTETALDCGGLCPRCLDRSPCNVPDDCVNDNCFENICISCGSGVIDGFETDIDCGGTDPFCQRCRPGQRCLIPGDCQSGACNGGVCG